VYNQYKYIVQLVGGEICVYPTNLIFINSHHTINFKTGAHQFSIGIIFSRP